MSAPMASSSKSPFEFIQFHSTISIPSSPGQRFLKAKVTILQQELDLSHKDNAKHLEQLDRFGEQQKKLEMARDQLGNKLNAAKSQVEKLQQQIADDESNAKVRQCHRIHTKWKINIFFSLRGPTGKRRGNEFVAQRMC